MTESNIKTEQQRQFYKSLENYTDKDLQEYHAFLAFQTAENTRAIKLNVQFFFYLTIISAALAIIILNY